MKKIAYFTIVLSISLGMACSCKGGGSEEEEQDGVTLSVTPATLEFEAEGGSEAVGIQTGAAWTATTSDGWITLSPASGTGDATVTVTVGENASSSRSGTFYVNAGGGKALQSVSVLQKKGSKMLDKPSVAWDGTKRAGVTYQLLIYSFCDSDGDGVGDFNGIASKMDYFDGLGVGALWLSPAHPADSYHGYDVTDYDSVNPDYGTESDFQNLISTAKSHDIDIYMDYVLNHTGKGHPWFLSAKEDESSQYRDYYLFSDNPSADIESGKFAMIPSTASYNSGEWTSLGASDGVTGTYRFDLDTKAMTVTVTESEEDVTDGSLDWNIYYWNAGSGDGTAKMVDDGDGKMHAVIGLDNCAGFLVRKYGNWSSGSKYGSKTATTVTLGEAIALVQGDNAGDMTFSDAWYYMSVFGSWMPDINYGAAETASESAPFKLIAASADKWIEMGVAGLRLDAVKHIYYDASSDENTKFLSQWYDHCNATYKAAGNSDDIFMVGEVFNEATDSSSPYSVYLGGLPSVFEFGFWWRLSEVLNNASASSFVSSVMSYNQIYHDMDGIPSIKLSNHDEDRAGETLGKSLAKEKQAAVFLLTAEGKPFVYQGEELGYYGSKSGGDEYVRSPIKWTKDGKVASGALGGKVDSGMLTSDISVEAQEGDEDSLLETYEYFSSVRNQYPALADGEMSAYSGSVGKTVAAWYMTDSDGNKALVLHNVGTSSVTMSVSDDLSKPIALLGSASVSGSNLTLGGNSSVVFGL